jgi:gliding motility-associated-like protein
MRYQKQIIFILLFFFFSDAFSQYGNQIWYFGEYAGINFNTSPPTSLSNGSLQAYDNTSTISDANGNLLFYTNGVKVWDKNHNQMPNGNNLGSTLSSGQSVLIVPQPSSTKYYIFTVGYASGDKFRYSIVDLSLNGGNGDVTVKSQILLNNGSTEKIDAVFNPADTSFWVMTHQWNSNNYYCYKITKNGLQSNPVISAIGSSLSGGSPNGYNAIGQMSFSKDGTKLASAIFDMGKIEIFDFNIATGQLSNAISLSGFTRPWGIAFSFNNQYLYYTEWYDDKAIQLNISSGVPSTIIASKTIVGTATFPNSTGGYKIGYFEYGIDSILYIAKFGQNYISAITNPDLQGTNCGFVDNAINLGSKICNAGLSRVAVYYFPQQQPCSFDYYDTLAVCENDSVLINGVYYHPPNQLTDSLTDINGCDSIIHTTLLSISLPVVNLGNDTTFCDGDSIMISVNQQYNSVLWNTGDTTSSIYVNAAGKYSVIVSDSNLCENSDTININNISHIYIKINDTTICSGDEWEIKLPLQNKYEWFDGSIMPYIVLKDSGSYYVKITDICKTYTDSFNLKVEDCDCKIAVPNVFTPNSDGINDNFSAIVNCELDNYHLWIFNRWGDLIFETYDQHKVWDGKYNGKPVPDGVYFYRIDYIHSRSSSQTKHIYGTITVLR